jgi:hypothetical protein
MSETTPEGPVFEPTGPDYWVPSDSPEALADQAAAEEALVDAPVTDEAAPAPAKKGKK